MAKELSDYRGEFDPKMTYNDFSKEQLVRLLYAWWNIGLRIDRWFHDIVSEKVSEKIARECEMEMWVRIAPEEIAFMRDALNVRGNDVESLWKVTQNDIGMPQGLFDLTWDLKNPNHGILTIHRCGGYEGRLASKGEEFCRWMCEVLDVEGYPAYAHAFNPNIKVRPLKLPPKKSPNEPTCQWEYTLDTNIKAEPLKQPLKENSEKELSDYSGQFNPKLTYGDFSKEQLVRLLYAWWNIGLRIDTLWHQIVSEKVSEKIARECDTEMWVRIAPEEIAFMRDALNVRGNDVASLWKVQQHDIGMPQGLFDLTWDLKNPNHGILTIHRCGGYERRLVFNGEEYCRWMCEVLDGEGYPGYVKAFNPNMEVRPLKQPPKKNPDEPHCQWEYKLDKGK